MIRPFLFFAMAAFGYAFSHRPPPARAHVKSTFPPHNKETRLQYAALEDPMSKADSTKSGCPFLIQKYQFRTFDVPALFGSGKFVTLPPSQQLMRNQFDHDVLSTDSRPIILYDSNCPLSTRVVSKVLKYGNIRYAPLQSTVGGLLLQRMSDEVREEVVGKSDESYDGKSFNDEYKSMVVCDANRTYVKSSAMLEIMRLLTNTSDGDRNQTGVKQSKRFKLMQYLALLSYIVPNRLRDRIYDSVNKRKQMLGSSNASVDLKDERFVNDAILTGGDQATNLFASDNPPTRGSRIKIVCPTSSSPSITYDEEFPNGLCLVGGVGTISTVDLPMRIVLRVERESLGVKGGEEGIIAWVKPEEIALL